MLNFGRMVLCHELGAKPEAVAEEVASWRAGKPDMVCSRVLRRRAGLVESRLLRRQAG